MGIIVFLNDCAEVERIISHLKLTFEAERPLPAKVLQQKLVRAAEKNGEETERRIPKGTIQSPVGNLYS